MRKPNGYGSVMKLTGARRKPYAVRIHVGYKENGTSQYKYLGYYATRKEAEKSLANYNTNPFSFNSITFKEVFEKYAETELIKATANTQRSKSVAFHLYEPLHNCVFSEIRPVQVQEVINEQKPTMQLILKALWQNLENFAVKNEITNKQFGSSITTVRYESQKIKKIFTEEQIDELWKLSHIPIIKDALILIYTGFRVSEYLALKKDSIKDGCLVGGGKTEAGRNRIVPIHPRIMPLIEEKLATGHSDSLSGYPSDSNIRYHWENQIHLQGFTFHECRHTFRTRLDNADANEVCIDLLMGHKGGSVGKAVYTHKTIEQLKNTIALLR